MTTTEHTCCAVRHAPVDSPQAYILPLHHIASKGVALDTLEVTRWDVDVGKHGDTAVGETHVIKALENGEV